MATAGTRSVRILPRRASAAVRTLAGLALVIVVSVTFAGTADAHASLLEATPAADTTIQTPPPAVVLTFDESVGVTDRGIRIFDPSGKELAGIRTQSSDATVRADLPRLTVPGSYTVSWRVLSADGHPVSGAYLFHLGKATLTAPVAAGAPNTPLVPPIVHGIGITLALVALILLGAVNFLATDLRTERRDRALWAVVLLGSILVASGTVLAVGSSFGDSVGVAFSTATGIAGLVAVGAALFGLLVAGTPAERWVVVVTVVAVTLPGHAISLPPVGLSIAATIVHVAAAVGWIAALVWLWHRCADADRVALGRDVERWSPWGLGLVIALAATGIILVLERVGWDELFTSWYGRIAFLKLVVLGVAVVLAVNSRFALTDDDPQPGHAPPGSGCSSRWSRWRSPSCSASSSPRCHRPSGAPAAREASSTSGSPSATGT